MRQSKFTETHIVSILKVVDAGRPVNEIWRTYRGRRLSVRSCNPTSRGEEMPYPPFRDARRPVSSV